MRLPATVLALFLATTPALASSGESNVETVGALLLRLQEQSAALLIQHCIARLPDMKRPLETEYSRFRKRFRKATAPLRARIGSNAELSRTAPPELIREFDAMDAQTRMEFRTLDPQASCGKLRDDLSGATVESIRRNMESAFAQYTAAARNR